MDRFDEFFDILMENEGVDYTTPSYDGQHTKFGITQSFIDGTEYNLQVKDLDLKTAKKIYEKEFWCKLHCHKLNSKKLAFSLCDFSVNVGHKRAVRTLQRAVNLSGEGFKLKEDGIIGRNTVNALNLILEPFNTSIIYTREKVKEYNYLNSKRYESKIEILENGVINHNEFEQYVRKWQKIHSGWVNRCFKMM